jgi:uncharacterized damage-inducible protein DinB
MKELLDHYARYDHWANTRFVERLQHEPDEVLDRPVSSSFPSLRGTLLHIRDAENVWWGRLTGGKTLWPAEASTEIATLLPYSERLKAWVEQADEGELKRVAEYHDLRGTAHHQAVWQLLLHCFNHSTQHRGQVITLMRTLGLENIPANDLVVFQRL